MAVTLGEGETPLLPALRLSERFGVELWLKLEGANPTGSFKDRGMAVAGSRALEAGAAGIVCAATGNTAASTAATPAALAGSQNTPSPRATASQARRICATSTVAILPPERSTAASACSRCTGVPMRIAVANVAGRFAACAGISRGRPRPRSSKPFV
jgi:hypothetical protein